MKKVNCLFCKTKKICKKYLDSKNKSSQMKSKTQKEETNSDKPNILKNQSNHQNQQNQYEILSPLDIIEREDLNCDIYHKGLDFALKEENIHNIAITGNYGSGKSTVIDSYFRDKCYKDYLKISLATFSADNKEKTESDIKIIEKSILQQMFYRKAAKTFPFSRFKRIKPQNTIWIFFLEICLFASFLFFSIIIKPELFDELCDLKNKKNAIYFLIFAGACFSVIGFHITRFLLKFKLSKFTFQKIEFGLEDVKDESLLNKYIDEILYFFETTDYRIVIFEDLDRFNNPDIFYHLRELNSLINNYEKIMFKHKVVFIYALKDDIFQKGSDRTKFFDFIIPIIPVIDGNNSKAILLDNSDILKNIDQQFLKEVSTYIDDMRLLKNCINEFKICDSVIVNIDSKILFAWVIYKNFYPNYYPDLKQRFYAIKNKKIKDDALEPLEAFLMNKVFDETNINSIHRILYWRNYNKSDMEFLDLIYNEKNPNFSKQLTDVENIWSKLTNDKKIWNRCAILNNDLLDYLLDKEKSDNDLESFIDTMFNFDQSHPNHKFFSQYNGNKNLPYFYNKINEYILDNNSDYADFFNNNRIKLLQFFLCVDKVNENFINLLKDEFPFINDTPDFELKEFLKFKKENTDVSKELKAITIKYIEKQISLGDSKKIILEDKKFEDISGLVIECLEKLSQDEF